MPLEIFELGIHMNVKQADDHSEKTTEIDQSGNLDEMAVEKLVGVCVKQVLEILNQRNQR